MPILHVAASPRGGRSASLAVASAFLDAYRAGHPGVAVDTLDVWATDLPPFDGPALEAKYAGLAGRPLTDAQRSAWGQVRSLADRFRAADLIVMSVPMWNFGLPYRLKHLIDAVSQKDLLFAFDGGRPAGLLGGRRLVVIAARGAPMGGDFPEAEADHQVAYLADLGEAGRHRRRPRRPRRGDAGRARGRPGRPGRLARRGRGARRRPLITLPLPDLSRPDL